jgi:hypothetical protein
MDFFAIVYVKECYNIAYIAYFVNKQKNIGFILRARYLHACLFKGKVVVFFA